jgi:multiple sugar transport system substrate-binding protein
LADRADEALTGDLPDVFLVPSEAAPALSANDVVAPVDELLAQRGVVFGDTYVRLGLEAFSAEQRLQCMPVDVSPYVVLYRSDILPLRRVAGPEEEPVTAEEGWTWEQFSRAARLMTGPRVRGAYVEPRLETLMALVRSAGADLVDDPRDATTLTFSEDGARAALEEILDVLREPRLTPTQRQLERKDALTRFAEGRLGMLFATREVVPQLRDAGVPYDVMPLPRLGRSRTSAEISGLCLAASGEHQEAAADFLAWATAEQGATILAETGGVVPAHVPTLNAPAFLRSGTSEQDAEVFVDAVARAEIHPYVPGWPDVVEAVQSELDELFYAPVIDLDTLLPRIDEQSRGILDPESVEQPEDGTGDSGE